MDILAKGLRPGLLEIARITKKRLNDPEERAEKSDGVLLSHAYYFGGLR